MTKEPAAAATTKCDTNNRMASDKRAPTTSYKSTSRRATVYAITIVLFGTSQLLSSPQHQVNCQDFEDLNSKQQQQQPSNTFQPAAFSRQPPPQSVQQLQPTGGPGSVGSAQLAAATNRQRPVLSNRFSPGSANGQQQTTLLLAQPTNNVATAAAPSIQSGASNIEQMMKNALARTTQLNAAAANAAEPRIDSPQPAPLASPAAAAVPEQSRAPVQQAVPNALGSAAQAAAASTISATNRQAESSDFRDPSPSTADSDDGGKQTTMAANLAETTNGHETVYGDQRFANLFARRNNARKPNKFLPSEQVKAKPTLPSFIKSPPDPKQFSAAAAQAFNDGVPGTRGTGGQQLSGSLSSSSSSSNSQLRQQQQNRVNLLAANQQKKAAAAAAITSNSAAQAQNKRANAAAAAAAGNTAQRANLLSSGPKGAAASNVKPLATSKPATASSGNIRNQQDPASVIAMARKRLLANNALESAKLKQQQQQQAAKPAAN